MPDPQPTACPILSRMRQVAIANLRKRDRPALERIDLARTKNEAGELRRAQIRLEGFHPGAEIKPHPGGAPSALTVAAVPFIGQPDSVRKTSAQRRKFFISAIQRAMAL